MIARYSRPEMSALWGDDNRFKLWLEVEVAAMEAMAEQGIIPKQAVESVRTKGKFDAARVLEIEKEVKHDVIAFLTNVAEHVGPDARYLHWGMTSSDLIDTAFAIQLTQATDKILAGLKEVLAAVKTRAEEHKYTVCIGRSHGIHAEPTTFGLKVANWYAELLRQYKRIESARTQIASGSLSGAVGTYPHLGPEIETYVCKKFGLTPEPVATQVIPRDRHAHLFLSFAQLAASIERIAVEIRHLQRSEVREAEEFFSKGQKGSSAMPHKRNPILSENLTGLARLVRSMAESSLDNVALWHERDISHSSVERVIAPDITILIDFMLGRLSGLVGNLRVYPENMQKNLDLTGGLYFSGTLLVELAAKGISREEAYSLVQGHALDTWEAINSGNPGQSFEQRISGDKKITALLSADEIAAAFSLERHQKHIDYIFKRVFAD